MGKADREVIEGFICPCGTRHQYTPWVLAHRHVALVHTCGTCGRQHEIRAGRVRLIQGPTKPEAGGDAK